MLLMRLWTALLNERDFKVKDYCIISNPKKDWGLRHGRSIREKIEKRGGRAELFTIRQIAGSEELPCKAEAIIVLGGDGSIISVARSFARLELPIVAVNLGTVGYLAEIDPKHMDDAIDRLISGDFSIEERILLSGSVIRNGEKIYSAEAVNDIVLSRSGYSRIITVDVRITDEYLSSYRGDGVIVSTPTGSTAYNFSAGGPIMMPNAKVCAITPICPHSLNLRSYVTNAGDKITLEVMQSKKSLREEGIVSFDGDTGVQLTTGDLVEITRSSGMVRFIRLTSGHRIGSLKDKIKS